MARESHDHNFKNLVMDFPKETLQWLMPEAMDDFGPIQDIRFVREEPKKRKLSDSNLVLDMPVLFVFKNRKLLLWLVEFQEDKSKFSIYKLLRYTTDYMEEYPDAIVIPMVLFTDRKKWRKNVAKKLDTKFRGRTYLHFEYKFVKLFDFNARDYYHLRNPVIKILLPKMNYTPEEREEVIIQAYNGLYQIVSKMLFDKYVDFIDTYAQIKDNERERIYKKITEHKETAMLAQYIREKGFQEGVQVGIQKGIQKGKEGSAVILSKFMAKKFRVNQDESFARLKALTPEDIIELADKIMECDSYDDIKIWILKKTSKKTTS